MIPQERELVAKLADKPFTFLGINSDESRSALRKIIEEQKINWTNIYDGHAGEGPLSCKWNVFSWPTTFVLDHEGVIRYRNVRDAEMERAVQELLAKTPKKPT